MKERFFRKLKTRLGRKKKWMTRKNNEDRGGGRGLRTSLSKSPLLERREKKVPKQGKKKGLPTSGTPNSKGRPG